MKKFCTKHHDCGFLKKANTITKPTTKRPATAWNTDFTAVVVLAALISLAIKILIGITWKYFYYFNRLSVSEFSFLNFCLGEELVADLDLRQSSTPTPAIYALDYHAANFTALNAYSDHIQSLICYKKS